MRERGRAREREAGRRQCSHLTDVFEGIDICFDLRPPFGAIRGAQRVAIDLKLLSIMETKH
jgi:hypothetical protein